MSGHSRGLFLASKTGLILDSASAVIALDQFLEAFYHRFQNHYFAQMHRYYHAIHERQHYHDPMPSRPLDDPPY